MLKWTGHASTCSFCLCRPTLLVMCGLLWILYIVICCSFFLFFSMSFNRHQYFYLFGFSFKRIMHRGGLVSRIHTNNYTSTLIQETHLKQCNVARFQNKYYKLSVFSCACNKTKGVLILVDMRLHLTIEHNGNDDEGRFVFIRCKIHNDRLALIFIYCPNEADSEFFTNISNILLEQIDCPLVMGGDFNAVLNPTLDKSHPDTTANPSSKLLNKFIMELSVINLWRIQNTTSKDFNFFS